MLSSVGCVSFVAGADLGAPPVYLWIFLKVCLPFQGQILANLKAMDSDWFAQNYMGRKSKVSTQLGCLCISFTSSSVGFHIVARAAAVLCNVS